jgi:hypothetical protein
MARIRSHLTYANVMATIAVFIALGGGAYAVSTAPKNSVVSKSIKNGQVKKPDLADNSVTSNKVADGSLIGADIAHGAVGPDEFGALPAARVFQPGHRVDMNGQCINIGVFANGTEVPVTWMAEVFDSGNLFSDASNFDPPCEQKTKLVAPRDGLYEVSAGLIWTANSTGSRQLILRRNGTDYLAAQQEINAGANDTIQNVSTLARLSSGDYVQVVAWQNSGGDLGPDPCCVVEDGRNFFAMNWVGP